MNEQAREYILYLRQMLSLNRDRLHYSDIPTPPPDPERDAAMGEFLSSMYGRDHAAELREHGNDMTYWLDRYEQDLYDDLSTYCDEAECKALESVAVGYILRLQNNAFAVRPAEEWSLGKPVYAIGINIGMLWVCGSLCSSLLLEERQQSNEAHAAYLRALQQYQEAMVVPVHRLITSTQPTCGRCNSIRRPPRLIFSRL